MAATKTFNPLAQPQDQFLALHNYLFDQIMPMLSASGWKVLCFILRRTRGYQSNDASLSYDDIQLGAGIARKTVSDALKEIKSLGLITAKPDPHKHAATIYSWNQSYKAKLLRSSSKSELPTGSSESELPKRSSSKSELPKPVIRVVASDNQNYENKGTSDASSSKNELHTLSDPSYVSSGSSESELPDAKIELVGAENGSFGSSESELHSSSKSELHHERHDVKDMHVHVHEQEQEHVNTKSHVESQIRPEFTEPVVELIEAAPATVELKPAIGKVVKTRDAQIDQVFRAIA